MKLENGKTIAVALSKLSQEDRDYIAAQKKQPDPILGLEGVALSAEIEKVKFPR